MKMYLKKSGHNRVKESGIPNMIALTFIKNFLTDKNQEAIRKEYFINYLSPKQVNQVMKDIKWLFNEYKSLDVVTIKDKNEDVIKFML